MTGKSHASCSGVRRYQGVWGAGLVISVRDVAVRQCLLEFLDARIRDLDLAKIQLDYCPLGLPLTYWERRPWNPSSLAGSCRGNRSRRVAQCSRHTPCAVLFPPVGMDGTRRVPTTLRTVSGCHAEEFMRAGEKEHLWSC